MKPTPLPGKLGFCDIRAAGHLNLARNFTLNLTRDLPCTTDLRAKASVKMMILLEVALLAVPAIPINTLLQQSARDPHSTPTVSFPPFEISNLKFFPASLLFLNLNLPPLPNLHPNLNLARNLNRNRRRPARKPTD